MKPRALRLPLPTSVVQANRAGPGFDSPPGLGLAEGEPGNERKVVLTYPFWQQQFGGDEAAVTELVRGRLTIAGPVTFAAALAWQCR